jgi:hypothetical protein
MAHSDLRLTERYAHLGSDAMVEVRQRIAQILGPIELGPAQADQVHEGYSRGYRPPFRGKRTSRGRRARLA